jgi:hypothetical protein
MIKLKKNVTELVLTYGENMKWTGNFYLDIGTEDTTWISGCTFR